MHDEKTKTGAHPAFVRFEKDLYDALLLAPLTHAQLLVALAVVRWTFGHRNRAEGACVSEPYLAEHTGLDERTVRRVLGDLTSAGVIVVKQLPTGRRAALLALEPDSSLWGELAPGRKRDMRSGNRARLGKRPVGGSRVSALGGHGCPPYGSYGGHGCPPYRLAEEQYEDCSSEGECGVFADAPPLSPDEDEESESTLTLEEGQRLAAEHLAKLRAERRAKSLGQTVGSPV